jgi:hypothetical protein
LAFTVGMHCAGSHHEGVYAAADGLHGFNGCNFMTAWVLEGGDRYDYDDVAMRYEYKNTAIVRLLAAVSRHTIWSAP